MTTQHQAPSFVSPISVNDWVTSILSDNGWQAEAEDDYEALNILTLEITEQIDTALNTFLNKHG